MTLRIANGAGFLGDQLAAPRRLVESAEVDFLTLEYLAELTLSILARQREKNPAAGYAADFLEVLESLAPALSNQPQLRIVTNAGGMNPQACARAAGEILDKCNLGDVTIGVVTGDDLAPRLDELRGAGCEFRNLDTGQPLAELEEKEKVSGTVFSGGTKGASQKRFLTPFSANAYLGAAPIVEALAGGARMVITGRVADASLTVGPVVQKYGWRWDEWDKLAAASVAGHLIECGAQVTGGYSLDWQSGNLADVGYPIAEIADDGATVITKPQGTGGRVDRRTVVEQLVYEIGDPQKYLTPDVEVDFTTVEVEDLGGDRVRVSGASGRPAPADYKVSLAYHDGYFASAQLLVFGRDCVARANECGRIVLARLKQAGVELEQTHIECLGAGAGVPGLRLIDDNPPEVVLRMAVRDPRRAAVERFAKEIAPLITSGPAGLAGYAAPRSAVRPVFAFWPTTIGRDGVEPRVEVRTAKEWSQP